MSTSKEKQSKYQSITEFYDGKSIFITGAAGFLGVVLLESFLRIFSGIQTIYILLRPKKGVCPQERRKEIFSRGIFDELRKRNPSVFEKVYVVTGDIALPDMGMSEEDLLKVTENVTIVFHCAACISFFKPFRFIFQQNVGGVNNAIELCKKLKHCEVFVDTSTAYSNINHKLIIEERIYGIPYPAERFLEYFEKGENDALEQLHSEIKPDFPNHYIFCKCISENLIREKCSDIKSAIVRPGLIASAWKGPKPGYAEENSSLAQLLIAIAKGFLKVVFAKPDGIVDIIPSDVVANAHIIAAYSVANGRYTSPFVVNCVPYSLQQNTVYNKFPMTYAVMVTEVMKLFKKYPVPNAFRYTNHVWVVNNKVGKTLLTIFEHYIPAVGMDVMLILQGKKPRLLSLYRFLDRVMDGTAPFITRRIEFETKNFRDLKNAVSREKEEEVYTDLEGLNVEKYIDSLSGAPQYDWKNDKKTKAERLKFINRVYYFTIFIQVLSIFILFWALYAAFRLFA